MSFLWKVVDRVAALVQARSNSFALTFARIRFHVNFDGSIFIIIGKDERLSMMNLWISMYPFPTNSSGNFRQLSAIWNTMTCRFKG
jgi:hypothetical protein